MPDHNAPGLKDVLAKFRQISVDYYRGKLHDNVLNIFGELTEVEQRVFLRGVMSMQAIWEMGIDETPGGRPSPHTVDSYTPLVPIHHRVPPTPPVPPAAPTAPAVDTPAVAKPTIEEVNQVALIQLRDWVVKMITWGLIFGVCVFGVAAVLASSGESGAILNSMGAVGKTLGVIFGS